MKEFRLSDPLPDGTLLLEASAGTGKTYTIAALAVRFLVETELRIGQLLLITFSVSAANELRFRVFERIRAVAQALRAQNFTDELTRLVAARDPALAADKLERALAEFDSAAILTTHSFCQHALNSLGVLGDSDQFEQVAHPQSLAEECAADVYLARYAQPDCRELPVSQAMAIARSVCDSSLPIEPAASEEAEFGRAVRKTFQDRKHQRSLITFSDMVHRLLGLVESEEAVRDWLRTTYRAVLVDEFQDTDHEQWPLIRAAFVAPRRPTILIGDPKQSIYGFRNADLNSYLAAARSAEVRMLGRNHRSDRGVVDGVLSLFKGLELGDDQIRVEPVIALHPSRLALPVEERVWVRQIRRPVDEHHLAADVATSIGNLLSARIEGRRVALSDFTVLVRTHSTATRLVEQLARLGYPAVQVGGTSVWDQPAVDGWRAFLRALLPDDAGASRLFGISEMYGASLAEITGAGGTRLSEVLAQARQQLAAHGPSAALQTIREETGLDARLAGSEGGLRYTVDAVHIGELLDDVGRDPYTLLRYLDRPERSDTEIRLTTDDPAIQVMTLHAAKGLEFPIVLLPDMSPRRLFLNRPFTISADRRVVHVRSAHEFSPVGRKAASQALSEELRLLYVGLTRAKHLAVLWHVEEAGPPGPVDTLLAHHLPPGTNPFDSPPLIPNVLIRQGDPAEARHADPRPRSAELKLARLHRRVDHAWRRTSYSGLTLGLDEVPRGVDEQEVETESTPALDTPCTMGELPSGTGFGTLVHSLLERWDWSGGPEQLRELAAEHARSLTAEQRATLLLGLQEVVSTPLSPLTSGCLADIPSDRRLAELEFDLSMAQTKPATLANLADLLAGHIEPSDPLADYPRRLAESDIAPAPLTGFLTGSIDAVLQIGEAFFVVDYKTNRLASGIGEPLTVGHYAPSALAEAMMRAHYPLQAILYCAALHRFLRRRLPGYRPEKNLGGAGYLFVRGMIGPATAQVAGASCGVFAWRPIPELVVEVSKLLGEANA